MKMIQIRNVPDDLHRRLKMRAAQEGMTLSDFLLREAERAVEKPSLDELIARIRSRPKAEMPYPPSRIVREIRDAAG